MLAAYMTIRIKFTDVTKDRNMYTKKQGATKCVRMQSKKVKIK